LSLFLALGWTASVHAAPDGVGTKTVRQVNTALSTTMEGKTTSKSQEAKLLRQARKLLAGFLNIEELGQRALKDHWTELSAPERSEFLSLLRKLIETNYVKGLRTNLKYEVSYLGEKNEGEHLLVQTVVISERKGRPLKIEIDYLLSKSDGQWRTFDIKTDGIGLVENYRAMFNKLIGKSGFEDLLKRMRKKLAALEV
jgi:phospholipid transport system substrate-binding protein